MSMSEEQLKESAKSEESIIFSQAQHCAQRMVFMLVPLDVSRKMKFLQTTKRGLEAASTVSFLTNRFVHEVVVVVHGFARLMFSFITSQF